MKEIRIGDTVTIAGHILKLLRVEGDRIVYELLNAKGPRKINSYGLRAFQVIARMYNMEFKEDKE